MKHYRTLEPTTARTVDTRVTNVPAQGPARFEGRMNDIAERIAKLKETICSIGWYRPGHADAIAYVRKNTLPIIEALVKEREEAQDRANYAEGELANEKMKEKEVWLPLLEAAANPGVSSPREWLFDDEWLKKLIQAIAKAREAVK